ncbi:MAG: PqqD family protein [Dysgonamonadaceae bacterium]|nr:PqqD family protein [Dysgonamonadaceae bacterium]
MDTGSTFASGCCLRLDITPYGELIYCLPLATQQAVHFSKFANYSEAKNGFEKKLQPYRRLGRIENCYKCNLMRPDSCNGGCLAKMYLTQKMYKQWKHKLIQYNANISWKLLKDKVVAVDLDNGSYYTFNFTSSLIWQYIDQEKTIAEIERYSYTFFGRMVAIYWEFIFIDRFKSRLKAYLHLLFPRLNVLSDIYCFRSKMICFAYPVHLLLVLVSSILFQPIIMVKK